MTKHNKYNLFEKLIYFVLLFLAFFIQTSPYLFEYNSRVPSLILAVVMIVSFFENYWFSAIFGLFGGLLLDTVTVNNSGFHALLYMLTALVCSIVMDAFFNNNFASFAVLSVPVIVLHQFFEIISKSGFVSGIFALFYNHYLLVATYTFVSAFILYLFFRFILKKYERFKKPKGIIKKK